MRYLALAVLLLAVGCGDNVAKSTGGDAGVDMPTCGNNTVEGTEECDDGTANGTPGGQCDGLCRWACKDDSWCVDTELCNGAETCVDHRCVAGTDASDGTTCGTGKVCRNAACTDAVCGDGFVTAPEECDDANSASGDGCENNCKFSCASTDATRNCTPADACAGQGACNDSTHTCIPGTPQANDSACGTGGYCKNSVCTQPMCSNGTVEPGEICDHGASNGMPNDGCKADCTFACVNAATDCPTAAPACQMKACNASHVCAPIADPNLQNHTCGGTNVCNNGACVPPTSVCGNGVVESGEQCDLGSSFNGPGTGCETSCQFSCTTNPNSCSDGNSCNGTETCGTVTVNSRPGQKCSAGTAPAQGSSCGTNNQICLAQVCVNSTCGDNFIDSGTGETCEPPSSGTCDASCHTIVCGDGVRAGNEQCDDSNTTNLDGCDSTCKFEQCHRVNTLSMAFATDTYCTANALGGSIGSVAQGTIGTALGDGVKDGSVTIELKTIGLDDLTGTADPALSLGILTGTPATGTATYNGASDLDWWYATSASVIDAQRVPTTQTPASITGKNLSAGPADISITISLGGSPATLNMLGAKLKGNIGGTSTPTVSTGGTPGHLATEHLDPTLQSFATMTAGQLCGNVTAGSLAAVPIPMALLSQCSAYSATNTLLDVIIGGCKALGIIDVIKSTQPDKTRAGTGKFTLSASTSSKHVDTCKDQNNATVAIMTCLQNAAYSSSFKFTTDRVIAK